MVQVFPDDLQLPSSLPQRVTDLALELTKDLESEYEMVRAIEAYLKNDGGYRYSLQEASQTPEGKDYVDQFLFETMVGYCDNFSTAMTVMLRSIDIPARWTKGFSPGSEQTDADGQTYYQITNANAHSWVEVYFPSTGWVPFDPSPSFSSPLSRAEEDTTSRSGDSSFNENDIPAEEKWMKQKIQLFKRRKRRMLKPLKDLNQLKLTKKLLKNHLNIVSLLSNELTFGLSY